MRCPHCHRVISKGVEFCPYCGKKIKNNFNLNRPRQTNLNNMNQTTNPHKITKKAKLLLAGIFAVAVIGGATVHHIHYNNYIHSPQSVDLSKALNNHIVNSSTIDGHNHAINNLISSSSDGLNGSDNQVGSDNQIAFDNGSIKPFTNSDNSDNNSSDVNPIGYTVTKNTLTIQNNGNPSDNNDSDNTTSDAGNYISYKLNHVSDNGHELVFKPHSISLHQHDDGTPHTIPNKYATPKTYLRINVGKKIDG